MSDIAPGAGKRAGEARLGGGGLRIYKPGQGYYTRVGTVVGAAVLVLWGTVFLHDQLGQYMNQNTPYFRPVSYSVCLLFLAAMSILVYWLAGLNRSAVDFFIATEGEMKKVSWSSRSEVVRSTKVVIFSVLVLGLFLFVVDILFMMFFRALNVLRAAPTLAELFGRKS